MRVRVEIEGVCPLLMNRFVLEEAEEVKKKGEVIDKKKECEKKMYRDEDGCYIPSTWIEAMLVNAGKRVKKGIGTYREDMKTVIVEPQKIPLLKKENGERYKTYDEMLVVPVVVQRQRIPRARPQFNSWKAKFDIIFDHEIISVEALKKILEIGGKMVGIGDWRPKYGRFKVTKFEIVSEE